MQHISKYLAGWEERVDRDRELVADIEDAKKELLEDQQTAMQALRYVDQTQQKLNDLVWQWNNRR